MTKYNFPDVDGQRINAGQSVRAPFSVPLHEGPDATFHNVNSLHPFSVRSPDQDIARGLLDGYTPLHKFGVNPDVGATEEDVWEVGGEETLLTAAEIMYVACADNVNGIGQTMRVQGLDANWVEQEVDVVLNGNTPVRIGPSATWTRVHRAFQVGASPDPVGDVWIAENSGDFVGGIPQTQSNIHALVGYTDAAQQTLKALFTVPAGKIMLIHQLAARMLQTTGTRRTAEVRLEIAELALGATVSSPSWAPRRAVRELILDSEARVQDELITRFPVVLGELTNVHMRAQATTASEIRATFDALIMPA